MTNTLVPPRPDDGLPAPPPPYSVTAKIVAIVASAWAPYVALAVGLIMLLFERNQAKRAALKRWAKWTTVYLVVLVAMLLLTLLVAGDQLRY
jgi:hypothetical protein